MRQILLASLIFLMFSLNISIASAEILFSQQKSVYNLGDDLNVEVEIKPSQYTSTFFEMNLQCQESKVNIHKEHLTLSPGQKKRVSSSLSLTRSFLGEMSGQCSILANFGNEKGESQIFTISNKIHISINIANMSIDAGDSIVLKGTALKENGVQVNGFLEANVEGTGIKITKEVIKGQFEASLLFPGNTRAGAYVLNVKVYEKYQGEETNSGEYKISLSVRKKPTKLEIAISKQSIIPGESLVFIPILYDQANEEVGGDISVKIYDPFEKIIFQKILKSGEEQEFQINSNHSFGYWSIKAETLGLEAKRLFYVEEYVKASFDIVNDTLVIKNIGNTVYKKAVQISIGEIIEIKNIDLDVNQEKKLRLTGNGKYNVRVSDGSEELVLSDVSLTGQVIGVKDVKRNISLATRYPIVWLFLIAVFGLFILILVQRVVKKKFELHSPVLKKEPVNEKIKAVIEEQSKEKLFVPAPSHIERAEHSLVLNGRKENSGILAVRIKDLKNAKKLSGPTINNVIKKIVEYKGVVYETSEYLIGIFASPVTKTFENDVLALKVSKQIKDILGEHNQKMRHKIDYGVGLNSGELILKKEPNILRFTAIGNALNLAKKISDLSKDEILLSENMQNRLGSQIRAEKEMKQGINVYHIKSIIDRDKNKKFISDFLSRLGKEQNRKIFK